MIRQERVRFIDEKKTTVTTADFAAEVYVLYAGTYYNSGILILVEIKF